MIIYNTLSRKKETFSPINTGKVNMYVCGVTVYDTCHIGHSRVYVAFDVVYRYLKYKGYEVTYCRNFTDVDDKIIKRAKELNISERELTSKNIEDFNQNMKSLGNKTPDIEPRVTDHMDEIINTIASLIEKGFAYSVDGNVFYSIDKFNGYGKLSGRNLDDMQAGARVEIDKRKKNPMDFALWKSAKPGEISWKTPWGEGRPGWHIECSAMGMKYLGSTIDIHGGGKDLVFPHHENEIAQSEALSGKKFVNYWMHNGFVNIDQEKMSKSLGNFCSISDLLDAYHPETLRYFLLTTHYRSPINFCDKVLTESVKRMEYCYTTLKKINEFIESSDATTGVILKPEKIESITNAFCQAMDDDFNTAMAIGGLSDVFKYANELLISSESVGEIADRKATLIEIKNRLKDISFVLGILDSDPEKMLEQLTCNKKACLKIKEKEIESLIVERKEARKSKNFKRADEIRDLLKDNGIVLMDSPTGTTWKLE